MAFIYDMLRLVRLVTAPIFALSLLFALIEQITKHRKGDTNE